MLENEDFRNYREAIICPHCSAFAMHNWYQIHYEDDEGAFLVKDWLLASCVSCERESLWMNGKCYFPFPTSGVAPEPHQDMSDLIRIDYLEAASISQASPRGASALLRLCIQKLCIELGEPGKSIDKDIAALVSKGLDDRVQKALDVVRVVGNNAVHPGELNINDRPEMVATMFALINEIIEELVGKPKRLNALYDSLPQTNLKAIEIRNKKARTS